MKKGEIPKEFCSSFWDSVHELEKLQTARKPHGLGFRVWGLGFKVRLIECRALG